MVPITPTPRPLPAPGELFIVNGGTYVDPGDGMHHPRVAPWTLKAILLDPAYSHARQKLDCWFYFAQLLRYNIRLPEHADSHAVKDQLIRKAIQGWLEVPFDLVDLEKRDRERGREEESDGEREAASPPRGTKRKANSNSASKLIKRRKIQNIEDDLEAISAFSLIPVHPIPTGSWHPPLQMPTQYAHCVPLAGPHSSDPQPPSLEDDTKPEYGDTPLNLSPHPHRHPCTCAANAANPNGCPVPSGRFAIASPSTLTDRDIYVVQSAAGDIYWASFSFGAFEVLLQFGRGDLLRWALRRERNRTTFQQRREWGDWENRYLYASGCGYVVEFGMGERVQFWLDGFAGRVSGGKGRGVEVEGVWREEDGARAGMSEAQMRREWEGWRGRMTKENALRVVQVEL